MTQALLTDKARQPEPTCVRVGRAVFGGKGVELVAGPCSVESLEQLLEVGNACRALGIACLRGGAFKPRTSPYAFQGLGEEALTWLGQVRDQLGLAIITEVMSEDQMAQAADVVDCFQVGSRNMQNFELLRALGRQPKPVMLKRGFAATVEEFLMAAEYILAEGNPNVILCERGIRGFDPATRNVLDLASVALLKERTHLPVVVDPSHGTGQRQLIRPAARAAVAVGADGVMLEVHPKPEQSISDAQQAISPADLSAMLPELEGVAQAIGRTISNTPVEAAGTGA